MSRTAQWRKIEREYIAEAAAALPDFNPHDPVHVAQLFLGDWDTPPTEEEVLRCGIAVAKGLTQSAGGKVSGLARAEYNDTRVLSMLKKFEVLPLPRNLVAALVEQGIGRNPATAALQRLARAGKLPDVYAAHFR